MRRSRRHGMAAVGGGLALCLSALAGAQPTAAAGPDGSGSAAPSSVLRVLPPPTVLPPRLAFTDDTDELVAKPASGCDSTTPFACDELAEVLTQGRRHAGEASFSGGDLVYVSDADEPAGEVYVRSESSAVEAPAAPALDAPHRLTCDSAVETHPVLSPDRTKVAYASNEGGDWSIWVVWIDTPTPTSSGPPPPEAPCADLPRAKIADGPGADLWPTWIGDDAVAFSRSGPTTLGLDPLGDLYAARLGERGESVPAEDAVRLTDGPAAETQPRAFQAGETGEGDPPTYAIVFTTTEYRHDGSLAGIGGLSVDRLALREPSSLWPDSPIQSTEAVDMVSEGTTRIGFTTTRDDPFGDVLRVDLRAAAASGDQLPVVAEPESIITVSAESGRSESHLAFVGGYYDTTTEAVYTRRSLSADVTDVLAADGSGRRTVAATSVDLDGKPAPRDESTPAYSPDGTRIAYSRTAETGREIVTAAADGSDVRALLSSRPAQARDLEPAWSPDGTRIAFVRVLEPDEEPSTSQVFVATVATGVATLVSQSRTDAALWDENPSWSPDGARLAISRKVVEYPDLAVTVTAPSTAMRGTTFTADIGVTDSGGDLRQTAALLVSSTFPISTLDSRCAQILATRLECRYEPMGPGAAPTLPVSVSANQSGRGTISAQVVLSEPEADSTDNSASAGVDVTEPPDVEVTLDMPPDVGYLETETLTVTAGDAPAATRTGSFTITVDVDTSESSPGRVEFSASGLPAGCVRDSASTVRCTAGPLDPGQRTSFELTVVGTQGGVASVTATVPPLPFELETTNNSATGTTPVQPAPPPPDVALDLGLPGSFPTGGSGSTATVTISNQPAASATGPFTVVLVANTGDSTLLGRVAFTATGLPAGCVIDSVTTAHCAVADLAPGARATFAVGIVGTATGTTAVTAQVPPLSGETNTVNNTITARTTVTSPGGPRAPTAGPTPSRLRMQAPARPPTGRAAARDRSPAPSPRAVADPLDAPSTLWVIDATTGAGAELLIPPDPSCPLTLVCSPTPVEGRVPAWSPDGLSVAFEIRGEVRVARLVDADSDEVADRPETVAGMDAVTGFAADGAPTSARQVLSAATDPAWSADGGELSVAGQPAGQPDQSGIYALKPDGTGLRVLAQDRGPETEPAWQPFADVSIEITADPDAGPPGFRTDLEVIVRNAGPARAVEVTARLGVPPGLAIGANPHGCTPSGEELTCPVGTLAPDENRTFTFPATGDVTGSHTVMATVSTPTPDRVPDNNTDSVVVTVSDSVADLVATLKATPASGVQPLDSTLEATATNTGPQAVTVAELRVELPPGLTPGAPPSDCVPAGPRAITCDVGPLSVGQQASRQWAVGGAEAGSFTATTRVSSPTADPDPDNNVATATVTVRAILADLSVTVATTTPGYVGGVGTTTVTVRNAGPQASAGAVLTLRHPAAVVEVSSPRTCLTGVGACELGPLTVGQTVRLTAATRFRTAGAGLVTATVSGPARDPVAADNRATAPLTVRKPELRLSPTVVVPNGVTVATGTDFPPGARIELTWDVGIMQRMGALTVAADGTIPGVQIVVFRRDRLGPRTLTATGVVAGRFTPVDVDLLVAPRNVSPPGFVERN